MNPLKSFLTGADNETLAIGRVLGSALFVVLVIGLPALIAGVLLHVAASATTWFAYLAALQVYIPVMLAAAVGVIGGTNFTEPKPRDTTPAS